jgi:hypothetical protein
MKDHTPSRRGYSTAYLKAQKNAPLFSGAKALFSLFVLENYRARPTKVNFCCGRNVNMFDRHFVLAYQIG